LYDFQVVTLWAKAEFGKNMKSDNVTAEMVSSNNQARLSAIQWTSLILVALTFVAVYAPTFAWLWKRWMMGIWYQNHGLVVPFVVAFLIHRRLRNFESEGLPEGSGLGFLFLIPALMLHVLDNHLWSQILSAVSIVLALIGLSLLFLGRSRTLAIWFPLGLIFFMIPLPSVVIQPVMLVLRKLSAVGTEQLLRPFGIPVFRSGTSLEFVNGSLNIADACSGFATLSATLAFTVIVLYLWRVGLLRAIFLLTLAPPVALGANIFRCTLLSLMFIYLGRESLNTFLHPFSGYLAYGVGIGFQFGFFQFLKRRIV
jgi:exosortase